MNAAVLLRLGRVSNLPTVWTNLLAAVVLAGGAVSDGRILPLLAAMSLFYIGGMYLNDAFDAEIDARERPERPIPSGQISRNAVFAMGFAMLGAGIAVVAGSAAAAGAILWPVLAALGLAGAIVFYNAYHKGNPLSPVVMGLCRVLVYLTVGLCFVVPLPGDLLIGAALLLSYLIGLTYVAKQENIGRVENMWPLLFLAAPLIYGVVLAGESGLAWGFLLVFLAWVLVALWFVRRRAPGDIPRAVISLIAGICLLDGLLIAGAGALLPALVCVAGFLLTLALQRFVPGT